MSGDQPHFVDKSILDKGQRIGEMLMQAVGKFQENTPRTRQSERGTLGFSDLGACREYVRSTVTGAEKRPFKGPLKWEAFIGTQVGDGIEAAVQWYLGDRVMTQGSGRLDMGDGIVIEGHFDICLLPGDGDIADAIVDLKAKDGLETVRRDGPSLGNWIQISGYLVAMIQGGTLTPDATAHLVYYDRSGKDKTTYVASVDMQLALQYLEIARKRLHDVEVAIDTGEVSPEYLKDEPPSYCAAIGCPFFTACWGDTIPSGAITDPTLVKAVETVAEIRNARKAAAKLEDEAKGALRVMDNSGETHYVEGFTDRYHVQWTLRQGRTGITETLYVRDKKELPQQEPVAAE